MSLCAALLRDLRDEKVPVSTIIRRILQWPPVQHNRYLCLFSLPAAINSTEFIYDDIIMTPIDHGLSGGLLGLALQPLFRKYLSKPKAATLMIIASTLPDIDYASRLIGKKYYYNAVNNLFLSHRGFAHSLGGILFFAILILSCYALFVSLPPYREGKRVLLKFPLIFFLASLGGALHLFEDFLGPSGPWKGLVIFYPFSDVRYPGLNFYGWYDFYTIYLFIASFFMISFLNIIIRILCRKSIWTAIFTIGLVIVTFSIAAHHIVSSPGYHEKLGFIKAEAAWKAYQLSIVPSQLNEFSNKVQTIGMNTLFSYLPGLRMEDYVKIVLFAITGILSFLFIHMIVYLISLRWRKTLPMGSPIKNFLFVFSLLIVAPTVTMCIYYWSKTPLQTNPDEVPTASGFDYPIGDKDGKGWNGVNNNGWYIATVFLNPFFHPGEDWNGLGGGDTDLGQPVYSVAEGRVLFAEDSFRWGGTILIQHQLPQGEMVFSMYAHIKDLQVKNGEIVSRRQQIAAIGKGYKNVTYPAHLHFEIRRQNMACYPSIFWPRILTAIQHAHERFSEEPTKEWINAHYYHPVEFIRSHRDLAPPKSM